MIFETRLCSALTKVYADAKPESVKYGKDFAVRGERFAFQIAYRTDVPIASIEVRAESALEGISIRQVEDVPVRWLGFQLDDDVERREVGLFPDVLRTPDADHPIRSVTRVWRSVWVDVVIPPEEKPDRYAIRVVFRLQSPDFIREFTAPAFTLEVLDYQLPEQRLKHTEWFHVDCLAQYYRLPVWSEALWKIIGHYLRNMAAHGINMLYTPLFTPPLDTRVGHERLTVQLIEVKQDATGYHFDFSRLERWIKLAHECGIRYFEFSHLFTQWGAKCCPKVIVTTDRGEEKRFGWECAADAPEYREFLEAFLPALWAFLQERDLTGGCYFHISDEPHAEHENSYRSASELLRRLLPDATRLDALSDAVFYQKNLIDIPVPATDYLMPFQPLSLKERWCYYCCCETNQVSNRLLHFPSARNRIIGVLLYHYRMEGFLQWGFNYWMANLSRFPLNPYEDVSCDYSLPPGDAFLVYPGADGRPVDSLHYEVFSAGIQDMRLLELLEAQIGRKEVDKLLLQWSGRPLSMFDYPREEGALLDLRARIGRRLKARSRN